MKESKDKDPIKALASDLWYEVYGDRKWCILPHWSQSYKGFYKLAERLYNGHL